MKQIFSICVFILMLGVAAAQQPTNNLPDATNSVASNAIEEIKAKAEKGDVQAQVKLGLAYYYGEGVSRDYGEAAKWFLKVENESSNSKVQFYLFTCYINSGNNNEGVKWLRKAAENGEVDAQVFLGKAYAQSLLGVKLGDFNDLGFQQNYEQAVKWFRRAANQGDARAQVTLGNFYMDGLGVPQNDVEAYKWFNLAAAQNGYENVAKTRDSLFNMMTPEEIAQAQQLSAAFVPRKEKPGSNSNSGSPVVADSPIATGTGFFITDNGYLISNYHVVKDAKWVRIVTSAGTVSAKVVRVDMANDLALLKASNKQFSLSAEEFLDAPNGVAPKEVEVKFAPLPIAASRTVNLGGTVATVGFPNIGMQGFAPKLAKGEIASLSGAGDDPRYFQISVPVQPGNSGGALVDDRGNVIGIVSAKLNASAALAASGALPENVNYAVKSSLLLSFLESVPAVSAKLKAPITADRKFEDVVKSAQNAAVLVLVY